MRSSLRISFSNPLWYWRGPAPFYFVTVPHKESKKIKEISSLVSYGWGAIAVSAIVNGVEWHTSIFPKDGLYIVPMKKQIRESLHFSEDSIVDIQLTLNINPDI